MSPASGAGWRRLACGYLVAQAIAGLVWWSLLFSAPTVRSWFELDGDRRGALDAFFLPDMVFFVGASALSAYAIWREKRWATFIAFVTAGGIVYSTVCLCGWVAFERTGAVGLLPMLVASLATSTIAVRSYTTRRVVSA